MAQCSRTVNAFTLEWLATDRVQSLENKVVSMDLSYLYFLPISAFHSQQCTECNLEVLVPFKYLL